MGGLTTEPQLVPYVDTEQVRSLSASEFPMLTPLLREFNKEAGEVVASDTCEDHFWEVVGQLVDLDALVIFGLFHDGKLIGALSGTLLPSMWNGELEATELFWYVYPGFRARGIDLLVTFEAWAKEQGAKTLILRALEKVNPRVMERLYCRRGYQRAEVVYTKNI